MHTLLKLTVTRSLRSRHGNNSTTCFSVHTIALLLCLFNYSAFADPKFVNELVLPRVDSQSEAFAVRKLVSGLEFPWAIEFLPDQRILITTRPGRLWVKEGETITGIQGAPEVRASGQGGLLDVIAHPDFSSNQVIYLSYAAAYREGTGTRVTRARLQGNDLTDSQMIFEMDPPGKSAIHFGSRFAFDPDGYLFFTLGERGDRDLSQQLDAHRGKVIRIRDDGTVPDNNPFINEPGAKPEIFSYGHRNPQGLVYDADRGRLWLTDHGPRGGDALHIVRAGQNYGWPLATYGREYYGPSIGTTPDKLDNIVQPLIHWTPSIAPCGLTLYRGDQFPAWRGNLFSGALAGEHLRRIVLDGDNVVSQEVLLKEQLGRIRDVVAGPDGFIYFTTDDPDGGLFQIEPAK